MDESKDIQEYHSEPLESKFMAPFANIPYVSNVHYARPSDVFIPKGYFKNIENIKNFEFFEDDTVICGFLKTGTNWCERIVWALRNDIKLNIQHAPPVSVFGIVMGIGDFDTDNNKANDEIFSSMKRPRVIKMHLSYELLPRQFQQKQPKMIYMLRNPRDVCQSLHSHFYTLQDGFSGSLQDVVNLMTDDAGFYSGPFFKHVLGYWKRRSYENILIIFYEEMKKDLSGHIKKIADFLDIEISDEEVSNLAKHFSFDSMKRKAEQMIPFHAKQDGHSATVEAAHKGKTMFNKGKAGSWKALFTPDMTKQMEEWESKWLKDYDLKFIYE
ncbi:luciferin sulfotransferase-like isoform X1 [Clytia hemisphaerica]|uniref:Sulfotransferase domain-containing protein n=1 Tax=Clytia hemisphaerica TaxID=252671 RepID=A0A7M5UL96_9CNID